MTSSSSLPQEIWDYIVDHIAGHLNEKMHLAELRSAALAGRCFLSRAQFYIFRSISVHNSPRTEPEVRAERLLHVMTSSPHLIRCVQDLEVYAGDTRSLRALAQIPWSNVIQLTLGPVEAAAGSFILKSLAKLVGLPSVRGLVFRIGRWDATHLCNIFASCTSINRLIFVHCHPPRLVAPFARPGMPATLARPESITFSGSNPIMDLLLEPTCPLDLSCLTRLKFAEFDNPRINTFLRRVGPTLTHLHLNGYDRKLDNLDLDLLPNLTQIDAFRISEPFNRFLARLPATNSIDMINVLSMGTISKETFECAILERSMPALKRVNVQVSGHIPDWGTWFRPPPWEEAVRGIEESLPRLCESGLLRVVFVPFHGSTVFL